VVVPLFYVIWRKQISIPIGLDRLIIKMIEPISVLFQNLISHLLLLILLLLKSFFDASEKRSLLFNFVDDRFLRLGDTF